MFLKRYINTVKQQPMVFFLGMCVFSLAVMGTSVRHVSSIVFGLLVLLSFTIIKDWRKIYLSLSRKEKVFLAGLFLYTISALFSLYNVDDVDEYFKLFERYLRFTLIIPVYFLLIKKNVSLLNYLYSGAIISGPFLLVAAVQHVMEWPDTPAKGYYHHIIFGQLAMLNVGIMLSMLLTRNLSRLMQIIILLSMTCGLVTAVMSQARGVWLVFPFYVAATVYYAVSDRRISKKNVAAFLAAMVLLSMFTSVGTLIVHRTNEAISEVKQFYTHDQYESSVGTRLAMWDIAVGIWERYPLFGTGPGDFDDEVVALQEHGEYSGMSIHNSVHNIYIQALVGTGLVGLAALLLVIILPLRILLSTEKEDVQLAGLVAMLSFAIYGFSESWTLRLPVISVFLVYLMVITSAARIESVSKSV